MQYCSDAGFFLFLWKSLALWMLRRNTRLKLLMQKKSQVNKYLLYPCFSMATCCFNRLIIRLLTVSTSTIIFSLQIKSTTSCFSYFHKPYWLLRASLPHHVQIFYNDNLIYGKNTICQQPHNNAYIIIYQMASITNT